MVSMIQRVIYTMEVHEAEEGGYWAEVLELPGCVSQGETLEELRENIAEAIQAVTESGEPEPVPEMRVEIRHEPPRKVVTEIQLQSEGLATTQIVIEHSERAPWTSTSPSFVIMQR